MFGGEELESDGLVPPPLTDEQIEQLIAGDPEPPDPDEVEASQRIRVEELLAAGEPAPVTPVLAGQLTDLDPSTLAEEQQVALAVALQRLANHTQARLGHTVATY